MPGATAEPRLGRSTKTGPGLYARAKIGAHNYKICDFGPDWVPRALDKTPGVKFREESDGGDHFAPGPNFGADNCKNQFFS